MEEYLAKVIKSTVEESNQILILQKKIERLQNAIKKQRYGLVWLDVPEAFEDDVENKLPILKEIPKLAIEKEDDKPTHILIEGDNYHALTCLNYTHKGKVDIIYIDPPYNTGSDGFKYKDKRILDQFPDGSEVPKDHPLRHSYWLSFMKKRLELARDLLDDQGIIFISIDDNESAQLKLLCNEIFKERNLLEVFYFQVRYAEKSLNEKDNFQKLIEQVFVYAKDKRQFRPNKPHEQYDLEKFRFKITEIKKGKEVTLGNKKVEIFLPEEYKIEKQEKGNINSLKGTWASGSVLKGNTSGKFFANYLEDRKPIDGLGVLYKVYGIGEDGLGYRYFTGPKKPDATKGLFYSGIPLERRKEIEQGNGSKKYKPIINFYDYSPDFGNIRHEGGIEFRSGKKPIKMLKHLINIHPSRKSVVLDFFAGSGSTVHAVLDLNNEDHGNRQTILVTNNEGNIMSERCYPRTKNVINGFNGNQGLGGSVKYYKTDFVGKHNALKASDEDKIQLAHNAGEMLAIAENTLDQQEKDNYMQFFSSKDKCTAVYFREELEKFDEFSAKVETLRSPTAVYVFSWGNEEFASEFSDMKHVKVKTIPIPILEIYKQIYNLDID